MAAARAASAALPAARACEGPRRARILLEGALDDFAGWRVGALASGAGLGDDGLDDWLAAGFDDWLDAVEVAYDPWSRTWGRGWMG